ncbi:MAG TPA: type II toxin-antitoxin system death-on-curing family toxin [Phycisphaerales bacterium]|nr:type II toxin-antitoxin system death-on-curing family toxin [Phycisphaerales bacterium]
MDRPVLFLSVADVLQIQQDTIESEGGGRGVRDLGLLEAAVMQARQTFGDEYLHPDLAAMAAAYLFHIVMNHPFVDGNKRAGSFSAVIFLDLNGVTKYPDQHVMEEVTVAVASSEMSKDQLTRWMREAIS